ncbi:MAG: PAS domain S-box protein, partial [Oligoflexus sp.]|nr:PAS domain S-box protein [Pseudopedobacter sp.]
MFDFLRSQSLKYRSESSSALYGCIVFLIFLVITQIVSYQKYLFTQTKRKNEIVKIAEERKNVIQSILLENLSINRSLAYIVKTYGRPKDFNQIAKSLIPSNNIIDIIELTDKSIITDVYPFEANKKVINYNLFSDDAHKLEAIKAVKKRGLYFEGPIKLIQGGTGIVGRYPFFDNEEFLGFTVVVIKLQKLLNAADIRNTKDNQYWFALSKNNPVTNKEEFFLSKKSEFENKVYSAVNIDLGGWKLYVKSQNNPTYISSWPDMLFGFLFSLLCGFLIWFILRQPKRLGNLVRKKVLELKEHQYLLYQTQKLAKIGSWEVDLLNKKVIWSDVLKDIHEVPLNYEPSFDYVTEFYSEFENNRTIQEFFYKSYKDEVPFTIQLEITTKKNTNKWVEVIGEPVFEKGLIKKFIGSTQDITSEKNANLIHQNLSQQLKEIGASIPGVIYQLKQNRNKNFNFEYISDSSFTFFGLYPSDVYNDALQIFNRIHPDDNGLFFEALNKSAKDLKQYNLTFRIVRYTEVLWINLNSKPSLNASGSIIWNGTFMDVTIVQKAEMEISYLASLLENITDAIISTDENFVIKSWNKGAQIIYGWKSEEVIGKKFQTVMKTKYFAVDKKKLKENFLNTGTFNGEVVQLCKKGKDIEILMCSVLLKDKLGNITGSLTVNKNIADSNRSKKDSIYKTNLISIINKFNNNLIYNNNWLEVLDNSLKLIGETIQVSRIYYYQLNFKNQDDDAYEILSWATEGVKTSFNEFKRIPSKIVLEIVSLMDEKSYFYDFTENLKDGPIKEIFQKKFIKSLLIFPIKVNETNFGFFCIEDVFEKRAFSNDDIAFIKTICDNLSTAIEKSDYLKKLKFAFDEKNSILESIGDAFFAVSKNWEISYFNKVAEGLFNIR